MAMRVAVRGRDGLPGVQPRFEAYHHPSDRQGVMSTWDGAATWDNKAEAEAVAAESNERDRHPEYGDLGEDDWIVVDDREPPRVIQAAGRLAGRLFG